MNQQRVVRQVDDTSVGLHLPLNHQDMLELLSTGKWIVFTIDGPEPVREDKGKLRFCIDKLLYEPSDAARIRIDAAAVLQRLRDWKELIVNDERYLQLRDGHADF